MKSFKQKNKKSLAIHSIFSAPNLPTALFILRWKSEKYTKENMPVKRFGPHFSHNGLINLISWPVCHICIALSIATHIGYSNSHMAIWLYGHLAIIQPYGCTAIWRYGYDCSQYGCLRKEQQKCDTLAQKLN